MANRRVLPNLFVPPSARSYSQSILSVMVPSLYATNWQSEALIPNYNAAKLKVTSFSRAKSPKERSKFGKEFLETNPKVLVRAANAILGCLSIFESYQLQRSIVKPIGRVFNSGFSTAFRVGRGGFNLKSRYESLMYIVYFTHNHGLKRPHSVFGQTPVNKLGDDLILDPTSFRNTSLVLLTASRDKWSREKMTTSQVMLKTLQQARVDRIWKPARFHLCLTNHEGQIKPSLSVITLEKHLDVCVHHINSDKSVSDFGRET